MRFLLLVGHAQCSLLIAELRSTLLRDLQKRQELFTVHCGHEGMNEEALEGHCSFDCRCLICSA
jgi:cell division FtsZ-interacting protein ZapD